MYEDFLKQIGRLKVLPVIALEDAAKSNDLASTLVDGGLPVAEVTFRAAAAAGTIRVMADRGDILAGAGTVRSLDQAKAAVDAGAAFLVSPGFNPAVTEWAVKKNIPILPGVDSTYGLEQALDLGISTVKFFPAAASGGLSKINALRGPYGEVRFVPTGGITPGNLTEWLSNPAVPGCGGTWITSKKLLDAGDWDEILRLTREAAALADSIG